MDDFEQAAARRSACRRALLLGRVGAFALGLLALPALPGLASASDRSGDLLLPADSSSADETADSSAAGADDPVGHDANDDNGVDPVGHDANDDNGVDPAGHDANDDNGGASGSSGPGNASSTNSGRDGSGSDHGGSGSGGDHGKSGGHD